MFLEHPFLKFREVTQKHCDLSSDEIFSANLPPGCAMLTLSPANRGEELSQLIAIIQFTRFGGN